MFRLSKSNFLSRRALLLAVFIAAGSCALWAQADQPSGPPPGQMGQRGPNAERELAQLTEALTLTPDQQSQVKTILKERREKMEALRASGTEPTREQFVTIRKDTDTKITAILNDDQKAKFATWQQEHSSHHRGGGNGDAAPPPPGA
ncbi:MAG: periplasmic heavy metal sensor [Terracidiphilus sp.]